MPSARPRHATRWSTPLLLVLLAACGGGGGGGSNSSSGDSSQGGSTTPPSPPPAVGTLLNSASCELKFYAREATTPRVGTDPRQHRLWHLNNTASFAGAVAGEDLRLGSVRAADGKGQGIRVAVIDDALDITHEDLMPNVVSGSFNYNVKADWKRGSAYPLPCLRTSSHGTEVGGVIAARDGNAVGVAGVAPRASLVGLNALSGGEDRDVLDALTRDLSLNHVFNNSWGADDIGHFADPTPSPDIYKAAIDSGLRNGRDGLGSIYVFAAGNGAHQSDYSVYDGNVSLYGTIPVCSFNAAGKRAFYSEPGPNLLVCGPSGDVGPGGTNSKLPAIDTTEPQNTYADNSFNGTSAAAPMVSGVAALILQANPRLSWRDMRLVLAQSARKVDPTDAGWTTFGSYHFNHKYGFGAVDTDAAVRLARSWSSVGGSNTVKTCGPYTTTVDQPIPENNLMTIDQAYLDTMYDTLTLDKPVSGGLSSKITIPADCAITHIEHVEVKMTVTNASGTAEHPDSGHLQTTLTSPSNQTSTLTVPHLCQNPQTDGLAACTGLVNFNFGINRHLDEPAATNALRDWTLDVVDRIAQKSGKLKSWSITLHGR